MTKTFKQTCDKPYDRHFYQLIFEDGNQFVFDNYEDVQVHWSLHHGYTMSHVEVLDKKQKTKGFK